jgi:Glu-tRNA(Gln) amidotransferase subunit E-like FAD-binding protein
MEKKIKNIVYLLCTHEISKSEAIKELLNLKRFRKCDWTDIDGINYLKMMPETEIAKMVRDIVKKSNEA